MGTRGYEMAARPCLMYNYGRLIFPLSLVKMVLLMDLLRERSLYIGPPYRLTRWSVFALNSFPVGSIVNLAAGSKIPAIARTPKYDHQPGRSKEFRLMVHLDICPWEQSRCAHYRDFYPIAAHSILSACQLRFFRGLGGES
jgi:hypothetical protein